ncbi:glutathione S-transferase N-terminal domain-containing protein [Microbulbifer sp. 2205BS26-8]|uniref:glutathione S-transferase N-terminal domain-containing protein n=1 Tax=Microbulbifer sp. 2205BS26-8 TaxID=3064386 RepID=UPI00273D8572|nr:glutathione S-transferase N-terminal domain-containing protein [Microbulbifer sp. 2205BS26-8]MDP5209792.1 glutathione S-transferase N-terminal domain-containing protein [Microbulbifer sp. 2205BS26-8]
MQLYLTYSSPFARNVRIVVYEHGLQSCVSEHFSHPFHNGKELTSSNPLGKVPCLSLDNGTTIMDSEVICAYLDKQLGDGRLSKALDNDWNLKTLYSAGTGLMETLVFRQVEKVREREGLASEFWWQRYNNAIVRTLNFFESRIAQLPDTLSLLHINLGSALSYLDFRHEDFEWRSERPQLAVFSKNLEALESFSANTLHE